MKASISGFPAAVPSSAVLHTVHVYWNDDVEAEHSARVADALHTYAATVPGLLWFHAGLLWFHAGPNLALRSGTAHLGITAVFDRPESFLTYAVDPAHQEIIERLIAPYALQRSAIQIGLVQPGADTGQHA
jgi:hypothetical protein